MIRDFLGTEIRVGERAIRVVSEKKFKKVTIIEIDLFRVDGDVILALMDGKEFPSWTTSKRIIVQQNLIF